MNGKDKNPSGLKNAVNDAAMRADNDNAGVIFKSYLESAGVIGFFGQLVLSGFSVCYAEPQNPGLNILIQKNVAGGAPMRFNIEMTEHPQRGYNQPMIRTMRDDRPGEVIELDQIKEIREFVGYWIVDNLSRVTMRWQHGKIFS
jgi:hypothetical protein